MKKSILLFLICLLPTVVLAQIKITEIYYDAVGADDGHEWIEIQNVSQNAVDLSKFRLFESGTNHKLIPISDATTTVNQYAVIASNANLFKQDNPNFYGLIFDSVFSLSNTGESLSIKNSRGEIVDSISYKADGKDGLSLQLFGNEWNSSRSTPGSENRMVSIPVSEPKTPTKSQVANKVEVKKTVAMSEPTPIKEISKKSETSGPTKMIPLVEELSGNEKGGIGVYILGLIVIILAGLFGVYFLDNKALKSFDVKKELSADDFEITEEKEE